MQMNFVKTLFWADQEAIARLDLKTCSQVLFGEFDAFDQHRERGTITKHNLLFHSIS